MAPPFKEAMFDIIYSQGISKEGELIDMGCKLGILEKSGTWYAYKGQRLGQGKDNVRELLKAQPDLAETIEVEIRNHVLHTEDH